jgi:hypothetical protein
MGNFRQPDFVGASGHPCAEMRGQCHDDSRQFVIYYFPKFVNSHWTSDCMAIRIAAFTLLLLVSATNLWMDYPAVRTVLAEGFDYHFDSWNFAYYLFLVPIWLILYISAILLLIFALRDSKKHRHFVLYPLYVVIFKLLLTLVSPGLKFAVRFNYSLILGFSTDCVLFFLVLFGIIFHLAKHSEFPTPALKSSRKAGLL